MRRTLLIIFLIGLVFCGCSNEKPQNAPIKIIKPDILPDYITSISRENLEPESYVMAFVDKIVDGDTIKVVYKKQQYIVRLLDIDTPESVKEGIPVQIFSKEATQYTKDKALNQEVKLVFGKNLRDKYGRLLAYVILKDNTFLNAEIVSEGLARVEIIPPNTSLEDYFNSLQESSIEQRAGIWGLPKEQQPFIKDKNGSYIPRFWLGEKAS